MSSVKTYIAKKNTFFGIKEGDIVTYLRPGFCMDSKGVELSIDPKKETDFFELYLKCDYNRGDIVYVTKDNIPYPGSYGNKIRYIGTRQELKVVKTIISAKKIKEVMVTLEGKEFIIFENQIKKGEFYFFISSEGRVQREIIGYNPRIEDIRKKLNLYYDTKDAATAYKSKLGITN